MLKFIRLFTFFVLTFLHFSLLAQEASIVKKLNNMIKPILTLEPDCSFEDISFLDGILRDKEVVSLGEVTHGTREVFAYKDRLIRYLVSKMNYKVIAFEADYSGLETIDDYVNGKIDSTEMSPVYKPLFTWLRGFNKDANEEDRVHVYGLEMRQFNVAIDRILNTNNEISKQDKEVLLRIKDLQFDKIDNKSLDNFKEVCSRFPKNVNSKMLMQLIENYHNFIGSGKIGFRDKFMAENAIDLQAGTSDKKMIIWAHNGHVAKTSLYGKPAMGEYLVKNYKEKYYVIATDINKGNVNVKKFVAKDKPISNWQSLYYPEVNSHKGYEYYFKQCKFKNFILDVKKASSDGELKTFFTGEKEMRMIGGLSIPVNKKLSIANNFDMIVYFDETTSI
jgi:erythromycin esterase